MADGPDRRSAATPRGTRASRRTCAPPSPQTDPSLPVEETTYLGRPAWRGVFTVHEQWGMDGELPMAFRWDATVDRGDRASVAASFTVEVSGPAARVGLGTPRHQPRARPGAEAGLAETGDSRPQDRRSSMTARASGRPRKSRSCRGRPCLSSRSGRRRVSGSRTSPAPVHRCRAIARRSRERRGEAREGAAGEPDRARAVPPRLRFLHRRRSAPRRLARRSAASRTSSSAPAISRASRRCSATMPATARRSASRRPRLSPTATVPRSSSPAT